MGFIFYHQYLPLSQVSPFAPTRICIPKLRFEIFKTFYSLNLQPHVVFYSGFISLSTQVSGEQTRRTCCEKHRDLPCPNYLIKKLVAVLALSWLNNMVCLNFEVHQLPKWTLRRAIGSQIKDVS
jgi:hypothetical protein